MSDNFNIQSKNHDTRDGTAFALQHSGLSPRAMSTLPKTLTLDTSTSRANPTPQPMKRLTVPRIRQRKGGEPLVMLTAYTVRQADRKSGELGKSVSGRVNLGGGRRIKT